MEWLPDVTPGPVPAAAEELRPTFRKHIVKAPPGQEDTVNDLEMLTGYQDGQHVFYGYVTISAQDASDLCADEGGVIEIGFWAPVLYPFSVNVYRNGTIDDRGWHEEERRERLTSMFGEPTPEGGHSGFAEEMGQKTIGEATTPEEYEASRREKERQRVAEVLGVPVEDVQVLHMPADFWDAGDEEE